jgi:LPXTG-site transpeptidase (sortase) family protein
VKASASILLSFLVGALVTVGFARWHGDGDAAALPAPTIRPAAIRASTEPESVQEQRARHTTSPVRRVASSSPALINIPKLDLRAKIGTKLDEGPAWWPVTGRPGGGDTIAVAGHRTTHTRPFYWLDRLRTGDAIYIRWRGKMYAYRVSGRRILSARHLHIADARGHEVLLLSACNPRGSARQRIVVYARPRLHG